MAAVRIHNLSKSFGTVNALDSLSLTVQKGELFGFIGPDGAGKTTLFRCIASLLVPDSGQLTVLDTDPVTDYKKLRPRLGYMAGRFSLYPDLSVHENLTFYATIFGTDLSENYDLIRAVYSQLEPFASRPAGKLSGGMKQKLALCCALVHRPELLLLDEPTTGVDAVSRMEFWELLGSIRQAGITTIVSTPYMDEASQCNRVALMQGGRVLAVESPEEVLEHFNQPLFGLQTKDMYRLLTALEQASIVKRVYLFGNRLHMVPASASMLPGECSEYLRSIGFADCLVEQVKPTIEDCFIDLMA